MPALPITLFADFTCPFCFVTESALRRRARAGGVEIRYRAFELHPAPTPLPSPAEERGWREPVAALAEAEGLTLRAPGFRPRTRKAHEAARFAAGRGVEGEMRAAIFAAYWEEERDIGRIDVLTSLVEPLGIDPADLKIALDIDRHREEVVREEEMARRLRIRAVPALYLGAGPAARILLGAQSFRDLDAALGEAL